MRLLSFQATNGLHIGAITDGGVVDFSLLDPDAPTDLGEAIKGGQLDNLATLLANAGDQVHHQIKDLNLALPIYRPVKTPPALGTISSKFSSTSISRPAASPPEIQP